MDHPFRSLWIGTGFAALVGVGTLAFITAFAQAVPETAAVDQPEPMTSASFLTPPQHSEGWAAVRERFQHRRGRMELRHQGLELMDSVYQVSTDPARAATLAVAGRQFVLDCFHWGVIGERMETALQAAVERGVPA